MSDDALIRQFNRERCESAFAALVERHVQLVFATALRQVGNHQSAEEITQNVFLALARKAGRLAGHQTVAGWLYQATLREARLALRTQLRRQRREEAAAATSALHPASDESLAGVLPLLDEALAGLRDSDRLAVILRYLEEKSWKEVGHLLGVSEDAAQKRAGRAVEALGQFFARHGFKVSAGALTAGLTGQASAAVPVALAGTVTQAAVAKTAATTGLGLFLAHFMNLTKTQTTVATLLVCAAPIVYEANALRQSEQDPAALRVQLAGLQTDLENTRSANRTLADKLTALDQTMALLQTPLPAEPVVIAPPPAQAAAPRPAGWQEDLPYIELPKAALGSLEVQAINRDGKLTEALVDVLALTREEIVAVESLASAQTRKWKGLEAASGRYEFGYVPKTKRRADYLDMFTMRFPALPEQGAAILTDLEQGVRAALGDTRGNLFLKYAEDWGQETFAHGGKVERLITIARTGDPVGTVEGQVELILDEGNSHTSFHSIWTSPDDRTIVNLHFLPAPMQAIATRWHLNDRPR